MEFLLSTIRKYENMPNILVKIRHMKGVEQIPETPCRQLKIGPPMWTCIILHCVKTWTDYLLLAPPLVVVCLVTELASPKSEVSFAANFHILNAFSKMFLFLQQFSYCHTIKP